MSSSVCRHYFALSTNSGEQFFAFTSIAAWLLQMCGKHVEQPQEVGILRKSFAVNSAKYAEYSCTVVETVSCQYLHLSYIPIYLHFNSYFRWTWLASLLLILLLHLFQKYKWLMFYGLNASWQFWNTEQNSKHQFKSVDWPPSMTGILRKMIWSLYAIFPTPGLLSGLICLFNTITFWF